MLRNLWHKTAPLTLICMLSVKVKPSHDAHFSFFLNKFTECLSGFISFIEIHFIQLKILGRSEHSKGPAQ